MTRAPEQTAVDSILTLGRALELALSQNIDLAQTANQVRLNETSVSQEKADFLPSLSISASPSTRYNRSADVVSGQVSGSSSTQLGVNVSSSLTLFNGWENQASLSEARYALQAGKATLYQTREQILYQTATQYLQSLLNRELIGVQQENVTAQQKQLEQIEAFYKAGNRPVSDVLQQRATIAQARQLLLAARETYARSLLTLKETIRLDPTAPVAPVSLPAAQVDSAQTSLEASRLIADALKNRNDLKAQILNIEAAGQSVRAARSGYLPSISLGFETGTSYNDQLDQLGLSDQLFDSGPNYGLSISFTQSLFDRRRTKSAVERARVNLENERLNLERDQQTVAFEIQDALLSYQTTTARLNAAREQLTAATEALEATEARYGVGAATLVEVAQARSLHVEASATLAETRYQLLADRLSVAYATGQTGEAITWLQGF